MCGEQVVVFAVETFPIWWIVGVTVIDWFPSFLCKVQNWFDAGGDCAFNFFFEGDSLGSIDLAYSETFVCRVGRCRHLAIVCYFCCGLVFCVLGHS